MPDTYPVIFLWLSAVTSLQTAGLHFWPHRQGGENSGVVASRVFALELASLLLCRVAFFGRTGRGERIVASRVFALELASLLLRGSLAIIRT